MVSGRSSPNRMSRFGTRHGRRGCTPCRRDRRLGTLARRCAGNKSSACPPPIICARAITKNGCTRWSRTRSGIGLITREEAETGRADPSAPKAHAASDGGSGGRRSWHRGAPQDPRAWSGNRCSRSATRSAPGTFIRSRTPACRATPATSPASSSPLHGAHVFPDTNALFQGENAQPLYTVKFQARDLWGEAANPRDTVCIDLWEDYLAPA